MCTHDRDELASNGFGKKARLLEDDRKRFQETSTHPGFVELLLKMIDELPGGIVSWSVAGDSFVIKQASEKRQYCRSRHALQQNVETDVLVAPPLPLPFCCFAVRVCSMFGYSAR